MFLLSIVSFGMDTHVMHAPAPGGRAFHLEDKVFRGIFSDVILAAFTFTGSPPRLIICYGL